MVRLRSPFYLAWLLLLPAAAVGEEGPVAAEVSGAAKASSKPGDGFVRVRRDDRGVAQALEIAVVRFVPVEGNSQVYVDLVGAVHIADRAYYEALNKEFKSYDAVLYELVAPEGTRIPQGGPETKDRHPVSQLQGGMKDLLQLEHQLAVIDYTRENLVHADMSPEEFAQSMKNRGESFFQILLSMTMEGMTQQAAAPAEGPGLVDLALSLISKKKKEQVQESFARQWRNVISGRGLELNEQNAAQLSDLEMMLALFSNNRAVRLKRVMAEQMASLGGTMASLDGPEGSTIVTERNKKALEVLRRELDADKIRLAIFYGAAHLPDMEKRLLEDFGLKRAETRWITAWDLTDRAE
jgi:hypothetical protein